MNLREIFLSADTLLNRSIQEIGTGIDEYVLSYDEGSDSFIWVAPNDHTHLEADITDLDHDAVKFQGVPIVAPGTGDDGKLYQYNETSGQFEFIEIVGLEEVTPTNPIVTLKDIYVEYLEDNTVSSTTDLINWTTKTTLLFTPIEAGEYFISWQGALANTGQNKGCLMQILLDKGTGEIMVGEAINAPIVAGAYNTSSGFIRVTFDTNQHQLDVEFMAEAGTALVKDVRILVQRTLTIV